MIKFNFAILFFCLSTLAAAGPTSYSEARPLMKFVYATDNETFYCGCTFRWTRGASGKINLNSCGYSVRENQDRAQRLEWEHVVPAFDFGRQRACWRNGGRRNCTQSDPVFNRMEADMHNLVPAIGEINGDRSNFKFGILANHKPSYGKCPMGIDRAQRIAEPPKHRRGEIARIYFYMHDRYNLSMSSQQEQLFMAWHKLHPPTKAEINRSKKVAAIMGHENSFVTLQRSWTRGYRPKGEGLIQVSH